MDFLSDSLGFRTGRAPSADIYNGNPATDFVSLGDYDRVSFIVHHGNGATGTAAFTVEASAAADGSTPTNIPFEYREYEIEADTPARSSIEATGVTITAGSNRIAVVDVNKRDLPDGFEFVGLRMTEVVNSPVVGCVSIVLGGPRQNDGNPPSALS